MAMIKCPECGHQVSEHAPVCPSCGIEIAGHIVRCPKCGAVCSTDADVCPECGEPLHKPATTPDAGTPIAKPETAEAATPEEQPKKAANKKIVWAVASVVVLAVLAAFIVVYYADSASAGAEMDEYANAMTSDEPQVLQAYLDHYADAPQEHRDSVEAHLALLLQTDKEWQDVLVAGQRAAFERYIAMHPQSIHITEAKLKIDSLDFVAAKVAGTAEAYDKYLAAHPEGTYVDEASAEAEKLNAAKVDDADQEIVSRLFSQFFGAIGRGDDMGATAEVEAEMTEFLGHKNVDKTYVLQYMKKLHGAEGFQSLAMRPSDTWQITKRAIADGKQEYDVEGTLDQKTTYSDGKAEDFATFKVIATLSANMKIKALKLKKLVTQ